VAEHLTVIDGGGSTSPERGTERWAKKIRKDARNLSGKLEEGYMELARLLHMIYDTPVDGDERNAGIYTQWGYKSFGEYCEEELNIHRKKAQRLTRIWYNLEVRLKGRIDPDLKQRIVSLGFSKVRELVTVLTVRNAETWVQRADELSYPKLCKAIRQYREERDRRVAAREMREASKATAPQSVSVVTEDGEVMDIEDQEPPVPEFNEEAQGKTLRFHVFPDQMEVVEDALERAKQLSESDHRGVNLGLICTDFVATNDFGKATTRQMLRWVAHLEKVLRQRGLKFVLFDQDDEVVYGIKTLEKAAKGK